MGEELIRAGEENYVKDVDAARRIAEVEKPIREKMQKLAKIGVPQEIITKELGEQLTAESEKAAALYQEAVSVVDAILVAAVKGERRSIAVHNITERMNSDPELSEEVARILKERVGDDKDFSLQAQGEILISVLFNPHN